MNRIISIFLALLCICSLLASCNAPQETTPTTQEATSMNILQKADPTQDDTLNILMIGSSFCYYYVEELWGMLDAAGIKARVCNAYYSGCPLKSHWEWWKSGEANYQFFITDENGRVKTECVNLEYCLNQYNWDVISLQENCLKIYKTGADQHFVNTKLYLSDLWGYLKEQFPMSRHFWHQPWAYQVGADRNGVQMLDISQQKSHMVAVRDYAIRVCKEYDLERVNTGEAWHLVRQTGYDTLCARQGVNGGIGDYSHDGDIGGGQYLNACVWYEAITGKSCADNTYRPDYTLEEALIPTLQQAAHQAIESRNAQ